MQDHSDSPLAAAAARLSQTPIPLAAILSDLCAGLQLSGASLTTGKGLDAHSLASCGDTTGPSRLWELPTATWSGVHLFGADPSASAVAPWVGILSGALARRAQSGGDPTHRLFSAGTLMRMMAHDLRNLLGVFDQNLVFVQQGLEEMEPTVDATVFEDIEQVREASGRVLSYVRRVHELAHILQGPWPPSEGTDLFERGLQGFEGAQEGGIRGRVVVDSRLPEVGLDVTRVQLLATELVDNVRQASATRFRLTATTTPGTDPLVQQWAEGLPPGPRVFLTCEDDGEGMDVFVLARCGEPLFSHPPRSDRAGLGFSLVTAILGAVGGQMAITSARGKGTSVVLALPAANHPATGSGGEVTPLVPHAERLPVAIRLTDTVFRSWVEDTLTAAQFDIVPTVSDAHVLIADRDGADHYLGPPASLFLIGKGWPAGMSRPDAVMPPTPDRDGFIRRLSMAVARRARRS